MLVFCVQGDNNMFEKIKKKLVKKSRLGGVDAPPALARIKRIVSEVKKDSYSDFEALKKEIELMLLQPEKL